MKAAVLNNYGELPKYQDIENPVPKAGQILVSPVAAGIKNLDKGKASGQHYTDFGELPAVMGMDGVVRLADGSLAWTMGTGQKGLMAEQAVVNARGLVPVPKGLSAGLAAALPNALMGSDMALVNKGKIQSGDTVFVSGATGNTGMMAVQMAKYHKAGFIIATGRNPEKLEQLRELGADLVISLQEDKAKLVAEISAAYQAHPFDMVLDYLWGEPALMIFEAVKGLDLTKTLKYITIGSMAGGEISLPSQLFRKRNLVLMGSGIGSISQAEINAYFQNELAQVFTYAAEGKLQLPLNEFALKDIEKAWQSSQAMVLIND